MKCPKACGRMGQMPGTLSIPVTYESLFVCLFVCFLFLERHCGFGIRTSHGEGKRRTIWGSCY